MLHILICKEQQPAPHKLLPLAELFDSSPMNPPQSWHSCSLLFKERRHEVGQSRAKEIPGRKLYVCMTVFSAAVGTALFLKGQSLVPYKDYDPSFYSLHAACRLLASSA